MVKMVISNLNLSKASGPDYILVVVLKNCEDELVSERVFFPDCWKVSLVVSVLKNVGERSLAKIYHPVCLLSVVSRVFETLVTVDHLEKCDLF